jgi:hypothetical protein
MAKLVQFHRADELSKITGNRFLAVWSAMTEDGWRVKIVRIGTLHGQPVSRLWVIDPDGMETCVGMDQDGDGRDRDVRDEARRLLAVAMGGN